MSNEYETAIETLVRSRKELIHDIAGSGAQGGVGRSQQYAAVLVTIQNAIDIIEGLSNTNTPSFAEKMAAAKAAKKAQQTN